MRALRNSVFIQEKFITSRSYRQCTCDWQEPPFAVQIAPPDGVLGGGKTS
jgi:hypothetical protein